MTTPNVGPVFGAIQVEGIAEINHSAEVVRAWVEHKGRATVIIAPGKLATPEMFGMLMVDCIRHGARAFSAEYGMTESEALDRIWQGLDDERDDQTTGLTTIQDAGGAQH